MKATEQYLPVVLSFIVLYKVVLTFESVDEILKCDHSNESYWAVLSCGTVRITIWCSLKKDYRYLHFWYDRSLYGRGGRLFFSFGFTFLKICKEDEKMKSKLKFLKIFPEDFPER